MKKPSSGAERTPGQAKLKAKAKDAKVKDAKVKDTARASKPRKPATKAKSSPIEEAGPTSKRSSEQAIGESASRLIDQRIRNLVGWRGETLARMRALILEADPEMKEEWKWDTPVWSRHGIVCTGEAYSKVVKLTFAKGASVGDPGRLFNSSLDGNTRRAIDIHQGEKVDAGAFKALLRAAVAHNGSPAKKTKAVARRAKPVKLLSGGNPQIAKADGDGPVQEYIAAMPGWKRDLGKRLDALIERTVPHVCKAMKWNSPFYGIAGQGWFLGLHCFTKYVKLAFFRGAALKPLPPGTSKDKDTRYIDIHEGDALDDAQLASWVKQAAALPGWIPGRPS